MEPVSVILTTALGYILKGAAQSKTADTAKEAVLSKFWNWIKPHFIKDVPEIEEKPESLETETKTQEHLLELVKDESFFKQLVQQVDTLKQAGLTERNIVKGDIERVKKIWIGNKEYSPGQHYDRENIVEGNVRDADEFRLGNG